MRYPSRPWFHPLALMAQNPSGYAALISFLAVGVMFPWRYKIGRYHERQSGSAAQCLKQKTIRFYREIENMYTREALWKHPMWVSDETPMTKNIALAFWSGVNQGHGDSEHAYWSCYQRDMVRARRLIDEIDELRAKGVPSPTDGGERIPLVPTP